MEISFAKQIQQLKLGEGDVFHGEGILAITKALLQSGVSYIGGYQGAPVSHLLDVMVQAREVVGELGVQVEACSNEASAAAMLGASIHYPVRGAVTWKSIVATPASPYMGGGHVAGGPLAGGLAGVSPHVAGMLPDAPLDLPSSMAAGGFGRSGRSASVL